MTTEAPEKARIQTRKDVATIIGTQKLIDTELYELVFTIDASSSAKIVKGFEHQFQQCLEDPEFKLRTTNKVTLPNGQNLLGVHRSVSCKDRFCSIHKPDPSKKTANWPIHFDQQQNFMLRKCEHEIWHPDLDDVEWFSTQGKTLTTHYQLQGETLEQHDCDGCEFS